MTSTKKTEIVFIWSSPIPFLLTIIIPVAINFIFDFSPAVRPVIIWMTAVGVAISAMLTLIGVYLTMKVARTDLAGKRLRLGLATFLASFPSLIILLTSLLMWALPSVLKFTFLNIFLSFIQI